MKRHFSNTISLRTDNDDIMSRINKLIKKNKEYQETLKEISINQEQTLKLENKRSELEQKQLELDMLIYNRTNDLKSSVRASQKAADITQEENEKLVKNNCNLTDLQKLIKVKLEKFEQNDNINIHEIHKLESMYNRQVIKNLEKAEAIVDAPV
jgi:hypothetical protein